MQPCVAGTAANEWSGSKGLDDCSMCPNVTCGSAPVGHIHERHRSMGMCWCCSYHCTCIHDGCCHRPLRSRRTARSSSWTLHTGMLSCSPSPGRSRRECTRATAAAGRGAVEIGTQGRFGAGRTLPDLQQQKWQSYRLAGRCVSHVHFPAAMSRRQATGDLQTCAICLVPALIDSDLACTRSDTSLHVVCFAESHSTRVWT